MGYKPSVSDVGWQNQNAANRDVMMDRREVEENRQSVSERRLEQESKANEITTA